MSAEEDRWGRHLANKAAMRGLADDMVAAGELERLYREANERLYHVAKEYVDSGYTAGTGAAGERLAAAVEAVQWTEET